MKLLIVATILVIVISLSECKPAAEKLHEHDLERPYFADLIEEQSMIEFNDSHEKDILGSLKAGIQNIKHHLKHGVQTEHNDSGSMSSDSSQI